jgi:hypothetical protein
MYYLPQNSNKIITYLVQTEKGDNMMQNTIAYPY